MVLRNEHNLPVSYYSSNNFSQVSLPARAGRYECVIALDAYYLAAGEYSVDLIATHTNVSVDHRVDSAVRFVVDTCSPDGVPYNFKQSQGFGTQAMRLSAPIKFTSLPAVEDAPAPTAD
jgi:hypothetical protein